MDQPKIDRPSWAALQRAALPGLAALCLMAAGGCPRAGSPAAEAPSEPVPALPPPDAPPGSDIVVVPGTGDTTGTGVESGYFRMGRPLREGFTDEQPVHLVKLRSFRLDKTAVTNEKCAEFLNAPHDEEAKEAWVKDNAATGLKREPGGAWAAVQGQEHWPAIGVTWFGARAYCEWKGGRLPTEAEWEWAAVGPDWRVYPWGEEWDPSKCCSKENPGRPYVDVDSYPEGASWCGALNLAGNCWEWCADWYGPYPEAPAEHPTGPATGTERVIRGGFYNNAADLFRGSCRLRQDPKVGRDGIGFRCAYDPAPG